MLTITNAAVRLNRTLIETEKAIDEALEQQAALLHAATLALRTGISLDPTRSHAALTQMQKALGDLTSARSSNLRVHGQLLKFAQELGMTEEEKCPDYKTAELSERLSA